MIFTLYKINLYLKGPRFMDFDDSHFSVNLNLDCAFILNDIDFAYCLR